MMKWILFLFVNVLASANVQRQNVKQEGSILDVLTEMGLTTVLELIEAAGLSEALDTDPGPMTVFVPVADSLSQELVDFLLSDVELLTDLLTYHVVVDQALLSSDLSNELVLPTAQGTTLRINIYDVDPTGTVYSVNGVPIDLSQVDISASNGVIHFMFYMLLQVPIGDTVETAQFLANSIGDYGNILYAADQLGLLPMFSAIMLKAIPDDNPRYVPSGEWGFTIIVLEMETMTGLLPSDEFFSMDMIEDLLANDRETLMEILMDHGTVGSYFGISIGERREFSTLSGRTLIVQEVEGEYLIQDSEGNQLSKITGGDIPCTNGVVHSLDMPIIFP
ncbi:unnamed protein product [Darwinula stevensoni]|uniref:FAS1 domain-containing protein n=1 Tax=Darwinula stevensoni TaxID=69355 RepID=A0A7R8X0R6_9CRUS|nr:unnamed protein product [Darwinula stevensoni]CAG0881462.1 unnamed protein product [Darwinula stevensoni]